MQDVLTTAIELHQGGRLGQAAALYQQVLEQERENAVALHLLGVLYHQQGDHTRGRVDRPGGGAAAERAGVPCEPGGSVPRLGETGSGRRLLPCRV